MKHARDVDTSNLTGKRNFIALKVEANKLGINPLVNAATGLYNLKSKIDDLDVDKLKTASVDLKQLSDVVSKNFGKNTNFNKLNTK